MIRKFYLPKTQKTKIVPNSSTNWQKMKHIMIIIGVKNRTTAQKLQKNRTLYGEQTQSRLVEQNDQVLNWSMILYESEIWTLRKDFKTLLVGNPTIAFLILQQYLEGLFSLGSILLSIFTGEKR